MTRPHVRFLPIDRPRVQARHTDGRWRDGRLHGWVRRDGGWWAVVTYTASPGIVFYACLPADAVRQADAVRPPDGAAGTGGRRHPDAPVAPHATGGTDPRDTRPS